MRHLSIGALIVLAAGCFPFDTALHTYCERANCARDGSLALPAGLPDLLGPDSGRDAGHLSDAGAGGSGLTADAGVDAGTLPPCLQGLCLWRSSSRTVDYVWGRGVLGDSLQSGAAIFNKYNPPQNQYGALVVGHSAPESATGVELFQHSTQIYDGVGTASHYYYIVRSSIERRLQSNIEVVYDGTCEGVSLATHSFHVSGDLVWLTVGGPKESVCSVNLTTGTRALVQSEKLGGGNVTAVRRFENAEIVYITDTGLVGQVGRGPLSGRIGTHSDGLIGLGGTSRQNMWVVDRDGIVARAGADGGFEVVSQLGEVSYSIAVTESAVYVGAYSGVYYRSASTDGGFRRHSIAGFSDSRAYHLNAGTGYLHVVGDYGYASGFPRGSFFQSFQTP